LGLPTFSETSIIEEVDVDWLNGNPTLTWDEDVTVTITGTVDAPCFVYAGIKDTTTVFTTEENDEEDSTNRRNLRS